MSVEAPARTGRVHRAWYVAAVTLGALVAAAAFRSSTGAMFEPLEHEFGWSRTTTSGAVTLNLVVYGLTAPFAAALMERFGVKRVVTAALGLVTGVFSAANATGQLIFLPALAALIAGPGWRFAALTVSAVALLLAPLVWAVLADSPARAGTTPYGAEPLDEHASLVVADVEPDQGREESPARAALRAFADGARSRV